MSATQLDTAQALLAAVLAEPADDLHRLAYADWCLENGPAWRGELIHFQMRNDDGGRARWNIASPGGWATSQWLCDWLHDVGGPDHVPPAGSGMTWSYRRGFVAEVTCPLAAWLRHGPALVRRQPVERVEVVDVSPVDFLRPDGWWWWTDERIELRPPGCHLPLPLWRCLETPPPTSWHRGRSYASERAALADLSGACLRWAIKEEEER